jgi:hypothetical protein
MATGTRAPLPCPMSRISTIQNIIADEPKGLCPSVSPVQQPFAAERFIAGLPPQPVANAV